MNAWPTAFLTSATAAAFLLSPVDPTTLTPPRAGEIASPPGIVTLIVLAIVIAAVVFASIFPSKRGHQD